MSGVEGGALSFYVQACRHAFQSNMLDTSSWTGDLNVCLIRLRQRLACCVCGGLLNFPMGPKESVCHHYICRVCVGGKTRFTVRSCGWCKDHNQFVPNKQIAVVVSCFKHLCRYLASFLDATSTVSNAHPTSNNNSSIPTSPTKARIEQIIHEAASSCTDTDASTSESNTNVLKQAEAPKCPRNASSVKDIKMPTLTDMTKISVRLDDDRSSDIAVSSDHIQINKRGKAWHNHRKVSQDQTPAIMSADLLNNIAMEQLDKCTGQEITWKQVQKRVNVGRSETGKQSKKRSQRHFKMFVKKELDEESFQDPTCSSSTSVSHRATDQYSLTSEHCMDFVAVNNGSSVNNFRGGRSENCGNTSRGITSSVHNESASELTSKNDKSVESVVWSEHDYDKNINNPQGSGLLRASTSSVGTNVLISSHVAARPPASKRRKDNDTDNSRTKKKIKSAAPLPASVIFSTMSKHSVNDNSCVMSGNNSTATGSIGDSAARVGYVSEIVIKPAKMTTIRQIVAARHLPTVSQTLTLTTTNQNTGRRRYQKTQQAGGASRTGCRCAMATPTPGKLTCCGQRCPCYSAFKGCNGCQCRGCRNPRGDPERVTLVMCSTLGGGATSSNAASVAVEPH